MPGSPRDVLRMATLDGARAMGLDCGYRLASRPARRPTSSLFDFRRPHLVPAVNPAGTLVHTGQGRDVELVIVDGAVVVEDGRPMRADLDTILREGQAAADALWARAREG